MDVAVPDDDDDAVDALSQLGHLDHEQGRRRVDDHEVELGGSSSSRAGRRAKRPAASLRAVPGQHHERALAAGTRCAPPTRDSDLVGVAPFPPFG